MQPQWIRQGFRQLAGPLLLGPLVCGLAIAQEEPRNLFEQPPADVDQALKERIAKFYQFFIDGKFRQAEALVAEDSKDVFYNAEKKKYGSCDAGKITYSENFTKATAVVSCDTSYFAMGRQIPVKIPITSLWKLQDQVWFWYTIPPSQLTEYNTPVGPAKRPSEEPAGSATVSQNAVRPMISPQQLMKAVQADRESIEFDSSKASTQEVHVKNTLQGGVTINATTGLKGLSIKPSKRELGAGEEVTLVISFDPKDPAITCEECLAHPQDRKAGEVTVRVEPTWQLIPIQVRFLVPASAAK